MPSPTPPGQAETLASVRALPLGTRVSVIGVVTAEAGRLGTPSLLAVGDATGGLAVRLPSDVEPFTRGTLLRVTGILGAPYGQLEIRPASDGIQVMGIGSVPAAIPVGADGLAETLEGRLVSATGVLSSKPKRSAGGDLTIVLERDGAASVKVIADASSEISAASFKIGSRYQVVGVVGQRATHKDALDGYRICLRDLADLGGSTAAPQSSPASPSGSVPPGATATPIGTVTIKQALGLTNQDLSVDAVVTTPANVLDTSGRRIVVQDASGAIELLLPVGVSAPQLGTRIRADGRVGVAYGAPRFRADRLDRLDGGRIPTPALLRGQPNVAHEWQLVRLTGRIESVQKLGDRWRAELTIGSQRVPIVGQPGSGIASSALVEGRSATVVGLVRRPFPTATDRRFAILPRFPADLRVAGATIARQPSGGAAQARPASGGDPAATGPTSITSSSIDADLIDLDAFVGRTVRVGGLVTDLRSDGIVLDDGTTTGRILLRGAALDLLPLLEPDDAINAIGVVEQREDGPSVVVDDPGGIIRAGDPAATERDPATASSVVGASATPAAPRALAGLSSGSWLGAGAVGFATLGLLSVTSLAFTVLRRLHARRRVASRIAVRLAAFEEPAGTTGPRTSPERGRNTFHSA